MSVNRANQIMKKKSAVWIAAGGMLVAIGLFAGRNRISAAVTGLFNDRHLNELTPAARELFRRFLTEVQNRLGYSVIITSGYRTQKHQEELRKRNSYAVHPGKSPHVYGIAIDANFVKGGKSLKQHSSDAEWIASGIPALAQQYGLRWGGNFSNHDRVHFDTGWSPAIAENKFAEAMARFGKNGWFTADLRQLA